MVHQGASAERFTDRDSWSMNDNSSAGGLAIRLAIVVGMALQWLAVIHAVQPAWAQHIHTVAEKAPRLSDPLVRRRLVWVERRGPASRDNDFLYGAFQYTF